MSMRLRWLRTALNNLDEEADYIAAEDPAAVRLMVSAFIPPSPN
jgi:plasmid stabilization system protein ParE